MHQKSSCSIGELLNRQGERNSGIPHLARHPAQPGQQRRTSGTGPVLDPGPCACDRGGLVFLLHRSMYRRRKRVSFHHKNPAPPPGAGHPGRGTQRSQDSSGVRPGPALVREPGPCTRDRGGLVFFVTPRHVPSAEHGFVSPQKHAPLRGQATPGAAPSAARTAAAYVRDRPWCRLACFSS